MIRHKPLFYLLLLLVTGFLLAMMIPVEYLPLDTRNDKFHHGLIFFGLTLVCYGCLRINLLALAVVMSVLAFASESSQYLVSYRSANLLDLKADFIGITAALGVLMTFIVLKKWQTRKK